MTVMTLSADSQAITLLCSALALPRGGEVKPLSSTEWSSLAAAIHGSELQRPGVLLGLDSGAIESGLAVSGEAARRLAGLLARGGHLALELDRLASRGIWVVTRADDAYPPLLKERLRGTAPPVLFGAGRPALLLERGLAAVGSREADEASLSFATLLGRRCAASGFTVISGAARGVDTAAMLGSADTGGGAVGVVADALEKMTRRQDLREHVVEGNVTLVSPYHPSARFTVGNAMRRNRLIYCLAEAAVVVAAAGENGGTRGGALENLKAGWTPLFVRADDDAPKGNRDLLARGGLQLRREELESEDALKLLLERPARERPRQVALDEVEGERAAQPGHPDEPAADAVVDEPESDPAVTGHDRLNPESDTGPGDLFPLVWPRLERFLGEPRSEKEVAAAFVLEQAQARAWLKRAVAEGLVDRLERQRRYRIAAARPPELFAADDSADARSADDPRTGAPQRGGERGPRDPS